MGEKITWCVPQVVKEIVVEVGQVTELPVKNAQKTKCKQLMRERQQGTHIPEGWNMRMISKIKVRKVRFGNTVFFSMGGDWLILKWMHLEHSNMQWLDRSMKELE